MPSLKFTNVSVEKLPYAKSAQILYWDTELKRFGIRVSASTKTFICEGRINGKTVRITLGKHPSLSVSDARRHAMSALSNMARGVNPTVQKRIASIKTVTLSKAFDDYMKSRELERDTRYQYTLAIKEGYGDWCDTEMRLITKDMVEERHREFGESRGKHQANKFGRTLRAVFNYAIEKYEVDGKPVILVNPVDRMSKGKMWTRQSRRNGHLSAYHLSNWFAEVDKIENLSIRDYLKFIIYTGARRREAGKLRWDDVFMQNRSFKIVDPKNHITIELPLSSQLYKLLRDRKEACGDSNFVFPSATSASGHIEEPKKRVIAVGKAIGYHFTVHDLRRTFITFAEGLDISHYAVKALVNHKMDSSDVTAGYVQLSVERLRIPMQKISDFIEGNI